MPLLARGGVTVDVVGATRGEGGKAGDPPVCARSDLGKVREWEMLCAIAVLGLETKDHFSHRNITMYLEEHNYPARSGDHQ